jgi:predicted HD phosphohydrolase
MSLTATIGTTVDEVLALVDELDEIRYGGMDLRVHALACGRLALDAGADDTLVAASLLHDVGRARYLTRLAPGVPHEEVGRRFVEDRFGERAGWLVDQHVVARRYLATVDAEYAGGLGRSARSSLRRQGGALSARQVTTFEQHPWAADAVALRRWDDEALTGAGAAPDRRRLAAALTRAWTA